MASILLLFLPLLLTGCGSLGWFSSDDGATPAELVELENAIQPKTLWSSSVGSGSDGQRLGLIPFYHEGRIYAAESSGQVKAFDAESGELIWSVDTGLDISGGPGVGDGLVLLGTSQAVLVALNSENGAELWQGRVTSEILSVPVAAEGVAVVHTLDGKIIGFDSASGDLLWLYDRQVPILTLHGSSSPVISQGQVICGTDGGKLVSLDLATGDVMWESSITTPRGRTELERLVDIDSAPVVLDDVVYVTTYQGDTAAVSEDSGVLLWSRALSSYAGLAVDWRQLYVSDDQDQVWAIDQRNGAAAWKNDQLLNRRLSAPAVLGDYLLVGDFEGYLHWLATEDGHMVARIRVGGDRISAKPLVVDGVAYIYGEGGELTAVTLPPSPDEEPSPLEEPLPPQEEP